MSFSYSEITSRKNDKIMLAAKLGDKKHRDRENLFFTEGSKLLGEAIHSGLKIKRIFFTAKALAEYENLIFSADCDEKYLVSPEVYEKLTTEDAPQGIFSVIEKPASPPLCDRLLSGGGFIILEDIQNPLNLGAIFRCAYSLGGKRLILSSRCADVYGPKTLRAGMGSIFKSEFYICEDIFSFIEKQKGLGNRVFCTHLHSESLPLGSFEFKRGDSIVIGNEGHGVSDKTVSVCTSSVIIPMTDGADSLNAATASSILIWEMNKSALIQK